MAKNLKEKFRKYSIRLKHKWGLRLNQEDIRYKENKILLEEMDRIYKYPLVRDVQPYDHYFQISTTNGLNLVLRRPPHSDQMVFQQIFEEEEYQSVADFLLANEVDAQHLTIIDAGANVGYTSVYLLHIFASAKSILIEPDEQNINVLKQNIELNKLGSRCKIYRNALHSKSGVHMQLSKDFRDGKDWSLTTVESESGSDLISVSIPDLILSNNIDLVDVLKIDIEGGERFIFSNGQNLDFLKKVRMIALEIHDEFGIRADIYSCLRSNGFVIINSKQTTLAINKNLI